MANNNAKLVFNDTSSSWDSFKMPVGGSAIEIRKSVAELRSTVNQEKRVFSISLPPTGTIKAKR